MNFFRSILSDEPDPPLTENAEGPEPQSPTKSADERSDGDDSNQNSPRGEDAEDGGIWSFGGLMKTLATRSESVIETYRRDLKEFGSGLQKETDVIRDVASRAVKDLPTSIELGASAAQGSLESVGNAIDGVWKSTAEMITHGKDVLLAPSDGESDSEPLISSSNSFSSRKYSRFDAQLRAIQNDEKTYCDESDDLEEYNKWKLGFVLQDKIDEVLSLIDENGTINEIYKKVVPNVIDHETFWSRYFYKVHKLKLQEDVRANLVKRAISIDDDEELTWDVDDDDEEEEEDEAGAAPSKTNVVAAENKELSSEESPSPAVAVKESEIAEVKESGIAEGEKKPIVDDDVEQLKVAEESSEFTKENDAEKEVSKPDEKAAVAVAAAAASDGKGDGGGSCKDSDVSIVSTQPSLPDEEDMGWDEIEDLGSHDEKKAGDAGSPDRAEIRKRLSAAEDDEDLSWDIEDDDDEPTTTTK